MSATTDSSTTEVEPSSVQSEPIPSVSALFLIKFDQKVGYVIAWKRSVHGVTLGGAVEFKSLPSGLHAVRSDLVYFVHEGYAGVSAFVNGPASEAERNAHFVAVGILVPLSYGRLGRSWLHAHSLQKIAAALAEDPSRMTLLDDFWERHGADSTTCQDLDSSGQGHASASGKKSRPSVLHDRARALSTITAALPPEQSLPSFHPALSILEYIDMFGPLVFRLQEAALLRKRILIMTSPPIRPACEFVYNLSVLSSIPQSVFSLLPAGSESLHRIRALFTIGIHDIPELEKLQRSQTGETGASEGAVLAEGWVACTTDEIIATKSQLYDIIVELPPVYDAKPQTRRWPTIKTSQGTAVKATQRDLWRYKVLRHELSRFRDDSSSPPTEEADHDDDDTTPLVQPSESDDDDSINEIYDEKVVEPMTWSQLAYNGFMWWASAGEKDAYVSQEQERDRTLIGDLSDFLPDGEQNERLGSSDSSAGHVQAALHTAIIAYFHRWTSSMVNTLSEIIEESDSAQDEDEEPIVITQNDVSRLGLDRWSEPDKWFVEDFVWMYFGKRSEVQGTKIECCGVRIC